MFLSSDKRLQETVFKTLLDGKEIKLSQNSLIFHFFVKNTTAVKSLFANYLLTICYNHRSRCCHLNISHLDLGSL